jgi:hypothetical protein
MSLLSSLLVFIGPSFEVGEGFHVYCSEDLSKSNHYFIPYLCDSGDFPLASTKSLRKLGDFLHMRVWQLL